MKEEKETKKERAKKRHSDIMKEGNKDRKSEKEGIK